ncbi:MAG: M48 family metallopeptidase [Gaiellaceae bacterium]
MRRVEIGGRVVDIPVRASRRARKLTIHVDASRNVEVVVPLRTRQEEIDALIFEHRAWLERQLAKPPKQFHLGLQRDDVVWIGGLALRTPPVASVDAWYREQARTEITRVVEHESRRLGVGVTRLTIRDQRTRWGSCTRAGALSFNWRLVLTPQAILTYVVVHELCHRIRHDHSPQFWALVAKARPTYEEERRWLVEHGPEVLAYRVPIRRAA